MAVLLIVTALVVGAAFLYFKEKAEHEHEEKMRQLERDEELLKRDR